MITITYNGKSTQAQIVDEVSSTKSLPRRSCAYESLLVPWVSIRWPRLLSWSLRLLRIPERGYHLRGLELWVWPASTTSEAQANHDLGEADADSQARAGTDHHPFTHSFLHSTARVLVL
jgi:hypothetical protein